MDRLHVERHGTKRGYLTHFPDATRIYQVSARGGAEPRWRGDGKELFYLSPAFQNNIMAVNVDESGGAISLGSPRTLFHVENIEATSQPFDVTPDGQRFLIATPNPLPGPVPLTLVMNSNAELKRK